MESQSKAIRKAFPAGHDVDAIALGPSPDAIVGGPSCQSISQIGKRDPNDPRTKLMDSFIQPGIELGVGYMLMEQVPARVLQQNSALLVGLTEHPFRAGYSMFCRPVFRPIHFAVPRRPEPAFPLISHTPH